MVHDMSLLAFGLPGGWEWIVIALFGLLLFGKRLPEVGKSLGRSIVEFKKGLKGVEEEINKSVESDSNEMLPPPDASKTAEHKS
jgi:sec-independent protein translocase protein TatA